MFNISISHGNTMDLPKNLSEMKKAHKPLASFKYEIEPVVHGYANKTLYINLNENKIISKAVANKMKDLFTGGRGFCLWLLWNGTKDTTKWSDAENVLIVTGGPIGGITAYPGSGKCTVVTISPMTSSVIDSNSGGYFGPYLKFAGLGCTGNPGESEK
jgi:aldehyde:ferredoxin oxidoreductase